MNEHVRLVGIAAACAIERRSWGELAALLRELVEATVLDLQRRAEMMPVLLLKCAKCGWEWSTPVHKLKWYHQCPRCKKSVLGELWNECGNGGEK